MQCRSCNMAWAKDASCSCKCPSYKPEPEKPTPINVRELCKNPEPFKKKPEWIAFNDNNEIVWGGDWNEKDLEKEKAKMAKDLEKILEKKGKGKGQSWRLVEKEAEKEEELKPADVEEEEEWTSADENYLSLLHKYNPDPDALVKFNVDHMWTLEAKKKRCEEKKKKEEDFNKT